MMKWTAEGPGGKVIGLGLEEKNLERLREGKPIHVFGAELGLPFDILIYYGKDMKELHAMTAPGIGPDTIIHDTREKKKQ